jgi:hypothetical protein
MKRVRYFIIFLLLAFLSNCHTRQKSATQRPAAKLEFQKMAWIEGIWTDPDDSVHIFTIWNHSNDTLLSGSSWQMKDKDSISTEIHEISSANDEILLSVEIFGKNDGNPDEYKLISNKNGEHVFESPDKEFPQRIIYILKPDGSLYLRMEGTYEGQSRFEEKKLTKIR